MTYSVIVAIQASWNYEISLRCMLISCSFRPSMRKRSVAADGITGSGSLIAAAIDGLEHKEGLSVAWKIDRPH
jgi:hypothetical protein